MIRSKLVYIFLLILIIASGFLYKDSFGAYFFQDDWFSLRISNAKSAGDFFTFFIPRNDVIYYRPLGMQVPFYILSNLFGVNPLPFHLLIFITHAVNIILVFVLVRLFRKNDFTAFMCAFMYAVSSVHYIPMFWSATYAFVLAPTFFFLSFILYLSKDTGKRNYHTFSWIVFSVGLLVNEMVSVLIPILLFYQIYTKKIEWKKLIPYTISMSFIFLLRFIVFTPPIGGSYHIAAGKELINNLKGYFLWSFNWPEEMKAQFVSFWQINPVFIKEFSAYFWIFLITFFISIVFLFIVPVINLLWRKKYNYLTLIGFCVMWFIAGLLPVLFFPKHTFSYYLPISLVGLAYLFSTLFEYFINRIYARRRILAILIAVIVFGNWIVSAMVTNEFNSKIHWAKRRSDISRKYVEKAKLYYPPGKIDSNFIYVNPTSENKLALNNQDAFRVVYNNDNIVTVYRHVYMKIIL